MRKWSFTDLNCSAKVTESVNGETEANISTNESFSTFPPTCFLFVLPKCVDSLSMLHLYGVTRDDGSNLVAKIEILSSK